MKTIFALFILVSSLILITASGFAAEAGHAADKEEPSSTSSESLREQKRFQITALLTGLRGNSILSGATGSLFLNKEDLLYFGVSVGQGFYLGDHYTHESLATDTFALGYKHFTSNSFYFRAGLNYTLAQYHRYENDGSGNSLVDQRLEGSATSANFAIGNQWQWSAFTLGCDWVGVSKPLFYNVTRDEVTGPNANSGTSNDSTRENQFVDAQLEVAHFYLGASF